MLEPLFNRGIAKSIPDMNNLGIPDLKFSFSMDRIISLKQYLLLIN